MSAYPSQAGLKDQKHTLIIADFRSDTLTKPCAGMRAAMAQAEVGDDVYGDDPTVKKLEARLAELLGKEAALFLPSGTQSNLCAMLSHCGRGEEIITALGYHVFAHEAQGASVLGGVAFHPLPVGQDGSLSAKDISAAVKPDDNHFPISRLLVLENTNGGKAVPLETIKAGTKAARAQGLSTHLDGARFFNAVTALGCSASDLAAPFDTVSVCLSKGLGTPAGSVLVGSQQLIARAHRQRKLLGGAMRQVGILAAAGLKAQQHTSMVFLSLPDGKAQPLQAALSEQGLQISASEPQTRIVMHKDVSQAHVEALAKGIIAALA